MTFIFVTHAQDEALALSDRVAVMHAGRVEQVDSPCVLYERPRTPFTATFVGKSNRLVGRITELTGGYATLAAAGCEVRGLAVGELRVGEIAACFVRPERMRLLDGAGARSAAPSAEAEPIAAKVTLAVRGVSFGGAFLELEGIIEGGEERDLWTVPLWAGEGAAERLPPEGARVMVGWRADDASIMPYGPAAFAASGDAGEGAP